MAPVLIVVPWFSKHEWLEVYEAAFADDVSRWKAAQETMIVWQARVEKLPAGVDVTLPLLQAKVIDADPAIENSVKSVLLATAVQRFVSSIVKLPQSKYYRKQTMHDLATDIGLPMHLVDVRNEIVHGSGGWAGGQTVQKALETAYEWIKGYYWDAELEQMQEKAKESLLPLISQDVWCKFMKILSWYSTFVIPESSTSAKQRSLRKKACKRLKTNLENLYPQDPQGIIEAVISHLLIPETVPDLVQKLQHGNVRYCGCFFKNSVIYSVDPLICSLLQMDGSAELLVSCLIKKRKENPKLVSEWIHLVVGSILGLHLFYERSLHCSNHVLNLDRNMAIKWETVVLELLETEKKWAIDIVIRIMDCPNTGFSESQKKNIKELLQCLEGSIKDKLQQEENAPENTSKDGAYTVDDIIEAAGKHSENTLSKVERLKNSTVSPGTDWTDADASLGVLPHQRDNPIFYKELLLHYPDTKEDIPQAKRCRK